MQQPKVSDQTTERVLKTPIALPDNLVTRLDREAKRTGNSRAAVVRVACDAYLRQQEQGQMEVAA